MRPARVFMALLCLANAGQPRANAWPAESPAGPTMTNEDVVRMVGAGLGESLIVGTVQRAESTAFVVTSDALIELKRAGVGDPVLEAMVERTAPENDAADRPSPPWRRDPLAPEDPGVYVDLGVDAPRLVPLEPNFHAQDRLGGALLMGLTFGMKKAKAIIALREPRARQRFAHSSPEFYFRFPGPGLPGQLGPWRWSVHGIPPTSANEFVLARLTVRPERRELIVSEVGISGSTGIRARDARRFEFERLGAGLYRVVPAAPLEPGEYAFVHVATHETRGADGGSAATLFDFAIDPR